MTRKALHAARPAIAFDPVPRRARFDGWTPTRQADFIETLARTGSLTMAAVSVNMSVPGAIWLRKQPGSEGFNAAWEAAVETGTQVIRDILVDHSLNGTPEDVWHAGQKVGERRRFNHRSMMWLVETGDRLRAAREARAEAAAAAAASWVADDDDESVKIARLRVLLDERKARLWGGAGDAMSDG